MNTSSSNISLFPTEAYQFDRLARMTTRTIGGTSYSYTYGDAKHKDAPTAYRGNTYSYDEVGSQAQNCTFDEENRITRIISGTTNTDIAYDVNGKRLVKIVDGGQGPTVTTVYIGNLYESEQGAPGLTRKYYPRSLSSREAILYTGVASHPD